MKEPIGLLITEFTISMFYDNRPYTIDSSHQNFQIIKKNLLSKNYEGLSELIDVKKMIQEKVEQSTGTHLKIEGDIVTWKGYPIHETLSSKLIEDVRNGYDVDALSNFIEKLMQNPSNTAIQELYLFIQKANMPITSDGDFIAYKRVNEDYTDIHTGKFDNSVGQILEMPRNRVDDNRDQTCSSGFHFCSYDYLKSFFGARVVVLKINPKDVVSIPSDHNDTKGRTCRYEVISEVDSHINEDIFEGAHGDHFEEPFIDETFAENYQQAYGEYISNKIRSTKSSEDPKIKPLKFEPTSENPKWIPLYTEVNGRKIYRDHDGKFISEGKAKELGIYDLVNNITFTL
jgi:hypothetical protein